MENREEAHILRLKVILHRPITEEEAERALEVVLEAVGAGADERNEWDWMVDPIGSVTHPKEGSHAR